MRLAVLLGILAAALRAQSFDPKMPAAVPPAAGAVVESAPLRYIEVQVGTGAAAKPGQEYTVHYTGWLRDGTKFDSSVDADKPLQFVQGRRQVIAGWGMGFEGMKAGGTGRLFLPYALAYGENGRGKIPPKAELIFDVELLDVKDVPPLVAAAELLLPFNDLEKQVLALAKAIPEEKYAWRPGPGVRSFKEVLLHIVYGNRRLSRRQRRRAGGPARRAHSREGAQVCGSRNRRRTPHLDTAHADAMGRKDRQRSSSDWQWVAYPFAFAGSACVAGPYPPPGKYRTGLCPAARPGPSEGAGRY